MTGVNRLRTQRAGSPLILVPPFMSGRIAMPACRAPGWLIDAEIRWQWIERPVGWHCARTVERPVGDRTGSLFGLLPAGRRPGHFRLDGPCRNRRRIVDARPRRYLKCQPHDIRHQVGDRDDQQNQTNAKALRHVLLLLLQAT
jgi:hypothetical protein